MGPSKLIRNGDRKVTISNVSSHSKRCATRSGETQGESRTPKSFTQSNPIYCCGFTVLQICESLRDFGGLVTQE